MSIEAESAQALKALIDEYRDRCLWFLRRDFYPQTTAEAERVLDAIQRHGDLKAFQRAAEIRRCLSRSSSVSFVGS